MAVIAMRTLFVGKATAQNIAMLTRMGRRGWGAYSADNLKEARGLIAKGGFDLVLALECLPDGSGYELRTLAAEQESSLFVEIELPHERLWMPVVEHGEDVFGDRASRVDGVEAEWEEILLAAADGKKDGRRTPIATTSADTGYAPVQVSLGPTCGSAYAEAAPKEPKISSIAMLQLRCASFGMLRAGAKGDETERFNQTISADGTRRGTGLARSNSGMHSRWGRG